MKQFRVIVTELHSTEYHVDADDKDKAIDKVLNTNDWNLIESQYNETLKDPDSMYVVEMKEDIKC